jgi:hypothetical protein
MLADYFNGFVKERILFGVPYWRLQYRFFWCLSLLDAEKLVVDLIYRVSLCHVQYLPVRPAWAGAWGTTQRSTPQRRWSASDPSASPYQRWHRSGPRVGDPLVAAPSSS